VLLLSTDGLRWSRVRPPRGASIMSADFVSAKLGFVVLGDGELLTTRDGGRRWRTVWATGRDDLAQVAFADARRGYVTLSDESDLGAVLRTSDGGRTWRPQVLSKRPLGDLVVLGPAAAVTLARDSADLFATASGGDAGRPSRLTLRVTSRHRLRRGWKVTVTGRLRPAPPGAGVAVTAYVAGSWSRKFARVSASGRFAITWRLRRGTRFVAQWRGAAGVRSAGTAPLRIRLGRR
jgi:Photosynthesis system II assembly factor YCF48